jgi:hypothetical protein
LIENAGRDRHANRGVEERKKEILFNIAHARARLMPRTTRKSTCNSVRCLA